MADKEVGPLMWRTDLKQVAIAIYALQIVPTQMNKSCQECIATMYLVRQRSTFNFTKALFRQMTNITFTAQQF